MSKWDDKQYINQYNKEWYKKNPYKKQKYHLKNKYNITIEQYNELFNKQQGYCAICGKHQSELKVRLSVDHNHETDEVRGLLCRYCNCYLGYVEKSPDLLDSIFSYLKRK